MNTLEGIIEDVEKGELVSDKVIKKVRELIGQEEWNDLFDEEDDIITTTGELLITLKRISDLEAQLTDMKNYCCEVSKYLHDNSNIRSETSVYKKRDTLLIKELKLCEKWGDFK